MTLPNDPNMLYSMLNMKLRDFYDSLEALCDDLDIDFTELTGRLAAAGYQYDSTSNRIV
ncbi:MAG: DUF4250 domain-containing protein [Lachnospiraceae bacterium]